MRFAKISPLVLAFAHSAFGGAADQNAQDDDFDRLGWQPKGRKNRAGLEREGNMEITVYPKVSLKGPRSQSIGR